MTMMRSPCRLRLGYQSSQRGGRVLSVKRCFLCGYACISLATTPCCQAWYPCAFPGQRRLTTVPYRRPIIDSGRQIVSTHVRVESTLPASSRVGDCSLTSEHIRTAYQDKETDGIVELADTMDLSTMEPFELIELSWGAADSHKGKMASMMNAWIGACVNSTRLVPPSDRNVSGATAAWRLLKAFDGISEELHVYPDMVTLSLAYTALVESHDDQHWRLAESILERSMKLSKKVGGSKLRKSLAASRRRSAAASTTESSTPALDVEHDLQQMLGSDFAVLHETSNVVVLSKPSGVVCYHKRKTTAGRIKQSKKKKRSKLPDGTNSTDTSFLADVSLEDALLHYNIPLSTLNHEGRGVVHRIDRGTSGCIVLAKTNDMHARLVTEFFLRDAHKSYRAVVMSKDESGGELPSEGVIISPVQGRPAKSIYSVNTDFSWVGTATGTSLLQIETRTGRKHQVRIHCAEGLGRPILLDPLYARKKDSPGSFISPSDPRRFFLHAAELKIPRYNISVEAPLPTWWESTLSAF